MKEEPDALVVVGDVNSTLAVRTSGGQMASAARMGGR